MSKYHRELSGALEFLTISEPARTLSFILNYWPLIATGLVGFCVAVCPTGAEDTHVDDPLAAETTAPVEDSHLGPRDIGNVCLDAFG